MYTKHTFYALVLGASFIFTSCDDDDETTPQLEIPSTYEFTRDGETTVSYSGQTNRLDMLSEMKSYIGNAHSGEAIDDQVLLNMYANENEPFSNADLNTSGKQLEGKTFTTDIGFFKALMTDAADASADYAANQTIATQGMSGLIERGTSGNFILVSDQGWEYQQIIEKGLMGAVFLNQIYNVYLTDDRTGDGVENVALSEGKNYTAMEHHWDEAFGYWGSPIDFPAELSDADDRFWAKYTYSREELLGTATALKDAFLAGRTAIVNNNSSAREDAKVLIYKNLELAAAGTTVHYINDAIDDINDGDQGNLLHHLSEAYAFALALKYSPRKEISSANIDLILNSHFGTDGDFWTVSVESLNSAKQILMDTYSAIEPVADQL